MAQKHTAATRNSGMESLEDRQFFSVYGTVNISLTTINPSAQVDYTRNGVNESWSAGEFTWARSTATPGTYANKALATTLKTYCIEPDQDVTEPTVNYAVTDLTSGAAGSTGPLSNAKASAIRELWGRFHSSIGNDNTKAAAFQMAIWELVCDGDKNLSGGSFSVSNTTATDVAVKAQAQAWLNQISGCGPKADLLALTNPCNQDQIFEVPACMPCNPCDYQHKCDSDDHYDCNLKDFSDCLHKLTTTCLGGHFGGDCSFTIRPSGSGCTTLSLCGGR